ncbi:sporulation delaying protein family toxin [Paenibacillus sp. NPDC057934]|uniref:sporulation delaying protein family toxin n=1 Tax=Paenibacillus sp. NPDC057934 TaxID=3346282 RepID=UPI0036DC1C55
MKKTLATLLTVVLVFGLVFMNTSTTEAQANKNFTNFSGEELFRGLFLGQGEVVEYIPELPSKKEINTEENIKFANDITEKVNNADDQYFNELREAVYSNNPKVISDSLEKGATLITSELTKMEEYVVTSEMAPDEATGLCVVWLVVAGAVFVFYAGVVVQVAAGAAYVLEAGVYLTTAAVQTQTLAVSKKGVQTLSKEVFVKSIVTNL